MQPQTPARSATTRIGRLMRDFMPLILVVVLITAGWGGHRAYLTLAHARQMACETFAALNRSLAFDLVRAGNQLEGWRPESGGFATIDRAVTQLSSFSMSWAALSYADGAVMAWQKQLTPYHYELDGALRSLTSGLIRASEHVRFSEASQADVDFVVEAAARLNALAAALRPATGSGSNHWRERSFPESQRQEILAEAASLAELCWAYTYEAAVCKGTREARVVSARAEEIAGSCAPETVSALGIRTTEIINWWAGLHYWQVWFVEESGQVRYTMMVHAQDGAVMGWGEVRDQDAPVQVTSDEAESAARDYLAANMPGEYVLGGWRANMGWWESVWFPRIDGITYFGTQIDITVSGWDGTVISCAKMLRTEPHPPARPSPTPLAAVARARLRDQLGGELVVVSEGWAEWRLHSGKPVLAWAVTALTDAEYRSPWEGNYSQEQDGTMRRTAAPTHLVGFVDAATGQWLGLRHLWLAGDASREYGWYGSIRR